MFDPMGHRASVHQQVGEQIFDSLIPLLQALCGTGADSPVAPAPVPYAVPPLTPRR